MNKSSVHVPVTRPAEGKLELPAPPEFVPGRPRIDPQVMLARCEENMPWRNALPHAKERRLAEKIPVEFVL